LPLSRTKLRSLDHLAHSLVAIPTELPVNTKDMFDFDLENFHIRSFIAAMAGSRYIPDCVFIGVADLQPGPHRSTVTSVHKAGNLRKT